MGLFSSSHTPEEAELRLHCSSLGDAAGKVATGAMPQEFFTEVWESNKGQIATLYDAVTRQKGPKAARNATKEAVRRADMLSRSASHNDVPTRNAAMRLVREALSRTVSGPVA